VELQHTVLAGACKEQVKFSELTLDIFRMVLTVEAPAASDASTRVNPHKHLLYLPSIGQLLVVLASICKDLQDNAAVLLYVSADPYVRSPDEVTPVQPTGALEAGLLLSDRGSAGNTLSGGACSLCSQDLMPYTRRPFVLVADSPGSGSFLEMKNVFGAPLLCLLSPAECPAGIKGPTDVGNIFTLFLHAPLHALWIALKQDQQLEQDAFETAEAKLSQILDAIQAKLAADQDLDGSIRLFMTDDLLCNMVLRFVFFEAVTQLHSSFKESDAFRPKSVPSMPPAVSADEDIQNGIRELADLLNGSEYMQ